MDHSITPQSRKVRVAAKERAFGQCVPVLNTHAVSLVMFPRMLKAASDVQGLSPHYGHTAILGPPKLLDG